MPIVGVGNGWRFEWVINMNKYLYNFVLLLSVLIVPEKSDARKRYLDLMDTMCETGENVYISCSLDAGPTPNDYAGPVASLCARGNTSPDTGYVQYRYGLPGETVEHAYPTKKMPPRRNFKIHPQTKELRSSLRFNDGKYSYAFEAEGLSGFKLIVRDGETEVINKWCDEPGVPYLVDDAYRGIEKDEAHMSP